MISIFHHLGSASRCPKGIIIARMQMGHGLWEIRIIYKRGDEIYLPMGGISDIQKGRYISLPSGRSTSRQIHAFIKVRFNS